MLRNPAANPEGSGFAAGQGLADGMYTIRLRCETSKTNDSSNTNTTTAAAETTIKSKCKAVEHDQRRRVHI